MPRALLLVLIAAAAAAADAYVAPAVPEPLARLPVLHQNRVKPFAVAADEIVTAITGKVRFGDVVERDAGGGAKTLEIEHARPSAIVLVDWLRDPSAARAQRIVWCPWLALQARLGLKGQWASLAELDADAARSLIAGARMKKARAGRTGEHVELSDEEDKAIELGARAEEARDAIAGRAFALAPLALDDAQRGRVLEELAPALIAAAPRVDEPEWRARLRLVLDQRQQRRANAAASADAATAAAQPVASADPGVELLAGYDIWLNAEDLALAPDSLLAQWPGPEAVRTFASAWGDAIHGGDERSRILTTTELAKVLRREIAPRVDGYPSDGAIDLELLYVRARPFTWAWIAYLLGGIATAIGLGRLKERAADGAAAPLRGAWIRAGIALTIVGIAFNVAGFAARLAITRWGAVTNLYETLVYVALLVAVLGLVFALTTRNAMYAVAGGVGAALCAMVGEALPPDFGSHLGQLRPVLRSSFWLWVHVKTIVASYAAFVLAMVFANIVLARAALAGRKVLAAESGAIYRSLQVGVVLCAAGTLLGGWWARQAWGRFWGWDPKEDWALIILLTYLIPLHLRYIGVVGPTALAAWSVYGFLSVVMSWYGVNFIIGSGLHAYAFGEGGQAYVYSLTAVQLVVTTIELVVIRRRSSRAAPMAAAT